MIVMSSAYVMNCLCFRGIGISEVYIMLKSLSVRTLVLNWNCVDIV